MFDVSLNPSINPCQLPVCEAAAKVMQQLKYLHAPGAAATNLTRRCGNPRGATATSTPHPVPPFQALTCRPQRSASAYIELRLEGEPSPWIQAPPAVGRETVGQEMSSTPKVKNRAGQTEAGGYTAAGMLRLARQDTAGSACSISVSGGGDGQQSGCCDAPRSTGGSPGAISAVCRRPPMRCRASSTTTLRPRAASSWAAARPAMPAPRTTQSKHSSREWCFWGGSMRSGQRWLCGGWLGGDAWRCWVSEPMAAAGAGGLALTVVVGVVSWYRCCCCCCCACCCSCWRWSHQPLFDC